MYSIETSTFAQARTCPCTHHAPSMERMAAHTAIPTRSLFTSRLRWCCAVLSLRLRTCTRARPCTPCRGTWPARTSGAYVAQTRYVRTLNCTQKRWCNVWTSTFAWSCVCVPI